MTVGLVVICALIGSSPAPAGGKGAAAEAAAGASDQSLEAVYQRELAYLLAEKRALLAEKEALQRSTEVLRKRADAGILSLDAQVLEARRRRERLEGAQREVERVAEKGAEGQELIRETIERAGTALSLSFAGSTTASAQIREIFHVASQRIRQAGALRRREGAYFGADGRQRHGDIIEVGEIAAYASAEGMATPLLPAGSGAWQVDSSLPPVDVATLMAGGGRVVPIHITESRDQAGRVAAKKTWFETIASGGAIAWVIVGLGVVALFFVFVRVVFLLLAQRQGRVVAAEVVRLVHERSIAVAQETCDARSGPMSRLLAAVLAHLDKPREVLEDVVSQAILHESPAIERFGTSITVAAAVAPLLGLLGTVSGMIATFDVITAFGTGDPRMLSGGISEALITTKLGLMVAIPTLLAGAQLNARADDLLGALEKAALQVINGAEDSAEATPELQRTPHVLDQARLRQAM